MASYDDTATVSGSVATFADGADEVGLKSCKITLPASLNGYTSVTEAQIPSRNMASMSDADFTLNSVRYKTENGILFINGTSTGETSSNNNAFKALDFWLPSGTYYFSRGSLADMNVATYLRKYDDKTEIKANQGSFTLAEKTHVYISFYVYNKVFSNVKATICVNIGSTAIAYEDTAPITTYTDSLGRTIYGGDVDIVNGVGQSTHGMLTLTAEMINSATSYSYQSKNGIQIASVFPVNVIRTGSHICSAANVRQGASSDASYMWFGSATGNKYLYWIGVLDTMGMTLEQWKTWALSQTIVCVYEEPTPTDFTFTGQEIPTRLGYNAFWSEQGNSEVTYYKDGYGFTSVTVHKETPDGEPVEETRKLHRIIYEGQVDVISGTGLIYRGESGTQYDPPETFTFPPIIMKTDEGENTLYADEGDSAITYRKETE